MVQWYSRVISLVDRDLLSPMFPRILTLYSHRAAATDCRRATMDECTTRPAPQPLVNYARDTVHIRARRGCDMSIDAPRQYWWFRLTDASLAVLGRQS